ncbi:MAG: Ribosome maturation factor RimM [Thermoanaerobacterales bacterium 50_218]|nr:MAG: Ribosome maturation factor RimM [Thermoanaerobacterales bacterium 50_218]
MEQLITIGEVVTSHGCRGEMKVHPFTDFPRRFLQMKEVFLRLPGGALVKKKVQRARLHRDRVILKLEGIDAPEEVRKIRGALLQVTSEELWPLPEGHYYIFQIVGLSVYTETGDYLGKVSDVLTTGSNDVYVVKRPEGKKDCLVPAIKDVVKKIDLENQVMVIHPLPGLIDE